MTFKRYFSFNQRLILNTNLISLENIEKKCIELKEKNLIDFFEFTDLETIKKNKLNDNDFISFCSNYQISVSAYKDFVDKGDLGLFIKKVVCNPKVNIFKSLLFKKFPLYACATIRDEKLISSYSNLEEILILRGLQDLKGIAPLPNDDLFFLSLLLTSLYIFDEDYEYKNYLRKWFISKELPLLEFKLKENYNPNNFKELFLFFIQWIKFFFNDNNVLLKNIPKPKILSSLNMVKLRNIEINRADDVFNIKLKEEIPTLKLFNRFTVIDNSYCFFYKSNFEFIFNISDHNGFSTLIHTQNYSNLIKVSKTSKILAIKIFSNNVNAILIIGNKLIKLEKNNNYQYDIVLNDDDDEGSSLIEQTELNDVSFESEKYIQEKIKAQPFQAMKLSNIKGFKYYQMEHKKTFTILNTEKNFNFQNYFKLFDVKNLAFEFLNGKKISTEYSINSFVYSIPVLKQIKFFSTLNHNDLVETKSFYVEKDEIKRKILIKNIIVDNQDIEKRIENYWLLKKLANLNMDLKMKNLDLIDQSQVNNKQMERNFELSDILAMNIKINIREINVEKFKFSNVFYLSIESYTSLILDLHIPVILSNDFFSINGVFENLDCEGKCQVFLNSFNNPLMKHLKETSIDKSKFHTSMTIEHDINKTKEITISSIHYILPVEIRELYLFVKFDLYIKNELRIILGLHLPLIN